jgi:hypothetical protein
MGTSRGGRGESRGDDEKRGKVVRCAGRRKGALLNAVGSYSSSWSEEEKDSPFPSQVERRLSRLTRSAAAEMFSYDSDRLHEST